MHLTLQAYTISTQEAHTWYQQGEKRDPGPKDTQCQDSWWCRAEMEIGFLVFSVSASIFVATQLGGSKASETDGLITSGYWLKHK